MQGHPLISIIVPSFNQGRYIRETLQSLVDQGYPNLEVIIQDGGSTDGALQVARDFAKSHPKTFHLFEEKDSGQANAINRGFSRARGEILGFLNSDDVLLPGCLHDVAREIDPARGRMVVFGRCIFTDETSQPTGIEHPSEYYSHYEQLAIWKRGFNLLPQPSVFWHRRVWERCGGLNESEHHALDYDLFCRFSRYYYFHKVDAIWSTYRLHSASKSSQRTESEVLDISIAVSRRHWGPWWRPLRWRCAASYWYHNRRLHDRARHYARLCEQASADKRPLSAAMHCLRAAMCSPAMTYKRLIAPWAARHSLDFLLRWLWKETGFTGQYSDRWIGPVFRHEFVTPANAARIVFVLEHQPQGPKHHPVIRPALVVNGRVVETRELTAPQQFIMSADLVAFRGKPCRIEIRTREFFEPSVVHGTPDHRCLSVLLHEIKVEAAST